jgi:hypothetical protein
LYIEIQDGKRHLPGVGCVYTVTHDTQVVLGGAASVEPVVCSFKNVMFINDILETVGEDLGVKFA